MELSFRRSSGRSESHTRLIRSVQTGVYLRHTGLCTWAKVRPKGERAALCKYAQRALCVLCTRVSNRVKFRTHSHVGCFYSRLRGQIKFRRQRSAPKQTGTFQLDWGWLFEGCLALRVLLQQNHVPQWLLSIRGQFRAVWNVTTPGPPEITTFLLVIFGIARGAACSLLAPSQVNITFLLVIFGIARGAAV